MMLLFNKTTVPCFVQVIYKAMYWIHMWSFLLPAEQENHMDTGCTRLMAVVRISSTRVGDANRLELMMLRQPLI
jgi:hypothetical protein